MKKIEEITLLEMGSLPTLYHGSPSIVDGLDAKKMVYGIFWTTASKKVALQYSKEKYYIKSEFDYIYEVSFSSGLNIANFLDEKNKYFNFVKEWASPWYKSRTGKDLDTETFLKDYADFGYIEGNPNIVKALKAKYVDLIICKDANYVQKHISYGFINKNKIVGLELVESIKR